MITPELLEYVRTGVAQGHSREEINEALISGGGWSEADLSEAFRILIPMQRTVVPTLTFVPAPTVGPTPIPATTPTINSTSKTKFKIPWYDLVFVIMGLFCAVFWYFYQPQVTDLWNRGVKSLQELSVFKFKLPTLGSQPFEFPSLNLPSFDFKFPSVDFGSIFYANKKQLVNNIVASIPKEIIKIKNCGVGVSPKLDTPSLYLNDPVLACLGASAVNCENAQARLKDDFFPTIFEIIKLPNACNFKLSYEIDSILTDITGKKLALQHISCPLSIVKAIDNINPTTPQFISPDKTNLSNYASQIYFYGILGLFVENKLDQNKIQALGCNGDYINSVIASYQQMQSNK